jgi:hypothetical protein
MAMSVQITVDCADPAALGRFWAAALGYEIEGPPEGFATWEAALADLGIPEEEWNDGESVVDPEGKGPRIFFQKVPEPKTVKNRVHLDVGAGGGRGVPIEERRRRIDAHADLLTGLGATRMREVDDHGSYFVTMADPEGNEFDLH